LVAFFSGDSLRVNIIYRHIYALGYRKRGFRSLSVIPAAVILYRGYSGNFVGWHFPNIVLVFEVKYSLPEIVMGSNNICLLLVLVYLLYSNAHKLFC
jgi:hypothetical protein